MATIVTIDDDYATEVLIENLNFRGHHATRINSADAALHAIDELSTADLVILDVIMQRPTGQSSISGDTTTGMAILKALRDRTTTLPVVVYSASTDVNLIAAVNATSNTQFISNGTRKAFRCLLSALSAFSVLPKAEDRKPL